MASTRGLKLFKTRVTSQNQLHRNAHKTIYSYFTIRPTENVRIQIQQNDK